MQQPPKAEPKKRAKWSLKWSLLFLIFTCWVLPLFFILYGSYYLSAQRTQAHVSDIVKVSINNAADIARRNLENVVDAALSASYIPTVRNAYAALQKDGNLAAFSSSIKVNFLYQQYSRSRIINASYLLFPQLDESTGQDDLYFAYNPALSSYEDVLHFYNSGPAQQALAQMHTLGSNVGFIQSDGHLYLIRVLSLHNNRFSPYAVLALEINLQSLYTGIQNLPWVPAFTLMLNDIPLGYGDVVSVPEIVPTSSPSTQPLEDNKVLVYGKDDSSRFSLEYYAVADLQPLIREMGASTSFILFGLLSIPLMFVVLFFFSRMINRPIRRLSDFAHTIEEGKFGLQINKDQLGSSEFAYLGGQLNAMSARLETQFERIYREELALRDARIKALQSQINPHFLGNTLEIINWEARLAGNVKVSHMLEALTTMLEAVLDRRHRPLIHLSEEMMYVNAYLYIIQERLGKRLTVEQDIAEDLQDWYVPRLVLQPIVENAVEHGAAARQKGHIIIRAVRQNDEWMRLEVINDSPLTTEDEERIHTILDDSSAEDELSSGNIGIRNVHQRLRIIYGEQSGLSIKTDKKNNTVSSMCIQYLQNQQNQSN